MANKSVQVPTCSEVDPTVDYFGGDDETTFVTDSKERAQALQYAKQQIEDLFRRLFNRELQ